MESLNCLNEMSCPHDEDCAADPTTEMFGPYGGNCKVAHNDCGEEWLRRNDAFDFAVSHTFARRNGL